MKIGRNQSYYFCFWVSTLEKNNQGRLIQIIGPVLDVAFPLGKMPNIYNALVVQDRDSVDQPINAACEILVHLLFIYLHAFYLIGHKIIYFESEELDSRGVFVFGGVGEHAREGNDLYMEMKESRVINKENIAESKVVLVYG
ncbi:hypothetical protein H5410_055210 [Solanum commersonii]|uniref:H(+)-transporting two-sector ATPase n=1 Tax=Solanum commersonii TaxID=4109 RepID=A0A9J5WIN6_SOLCO|nr:hypothetical protein H5410_055210 [Solanum commersonii]